MIEIKCTKAERLRLSKIIMQGNCLWPWLAESCFTKGWDCKDCINRRIKWIMTGRDARRDDKRRERTER